MLFEVVLGLMGLLSFAAWWFKPRPFPNVPQPGPLHPALGHTKILLANLERFFDWNLEVSERIGSTWQLAFPGKRVLKIHDPKNIEYVLKTKMNNFVKSYRPLDRDRWQELTGRQGMLIAHGKGWNVMRKTASFLFSARVQRDVMFGCFLKNGHIVLDLLEKQARGAPGEALDMQEMFFNFTMDSFCEIAFGFSANCLSGSGEMHEFGAAFDRLQHIVFDRRIEFELIYRAKKLFKSAREQQAAKDQATIDKFIYAVVDKYIADAKDASVEAADEKTRKEQLKKNRRSGNIIALLIDQLRKEQKPIDRKYLRDMAANLLLAGRDTTASLLTTFFMLLSLHPKVEAQVIAEVDAVCGDADTVTMDMLNKQFPYTNAVIKECLRLYPPAPVDFRKALQDDVLPDGTRVPRGSEVQYLPWVMGRLKSRWGPSANEFRPERWLEEASKDLPQPQSFEWPVFNAGLRKCLGISMSYLEARLLSILILQKYRLRLAPGQKTNSYVLGLVLIRKGGLQVTVEKR